MHSLCLVIKLKAVTKYQITSNVVQLGTSITRLTTRRLESDSVPYLDVDFLHVGDALFERVHVGVDVVAQRAVELVRQVGDARNALADHLHRLMVLRTRVEPCVVFFNFFFQLDMFAPKPKNDVSFTQLRCRQFYRVFTVFFAFERGFLGGGGMSPNLTGFHRYSGA